MLNLQTIGGIPQGDSNNSLVSTSSLSAKELTDSYKRGV